LVGVVVGYGFVDVVGASDSSGAPGFSGADDVDGPDTTGLSWLVCTRGTL
jgi:hypothetical protein